MSMMTVDVCCCALLVVKVAMLFCKRNTYGPVGTGSGGGGNEGRDGGNKGQGELHVCGSVLCWLYVEK